MHPGNPIVIIEDPSGSVLVRPIIGESFAVAARRVGIVSIPAILPREIKLEAVAKESQNYLISDFQLHDFEVGTGQVMNGAAMVRKFNRTGQAAITAVELLRIKESALASQVEIPEGCKGLLLLGSGFGRHALVLRRGDKEGQLVLDLASTLAPAGYMAVSRAR